MGQDISVGIATLYALIGAGIESRWGEIFHTRSDWPWGPPSALYNGYRVFPGGNSAGAWRLPPTLIYRRGWRKSKAAHLLLLWAFMACSKLDFTFNLPVMLRTYYPRYNHPYLWTSVQIINPHFAVPAVWQKFKSSVFSSLRVHSCLTSAHNLLQLSVENFAKKLKFPFPRNLSHTSSAGVRKCFYSGLGGAIWKWLCPGEPHEKSCAGQIYLWRSYSPAVHCSCRQQQSFGLWK